MQANSKPVRRILVSPDGVGERKERVTINSDNRQEWVRKFEATHAKYVRTERMTEAQEIAQLVERLRNDDRSANAAVIQAAVIHEGSADSDRPTRGEREASNSSRPHGRNHSETRHGPK